MDALSFTSPEATIPLALDFSAIKAAEQRIAGQALRTALIRSPELDEQTGGRIALKAEMLQVGGSFKFRGAYNRLAALSAKEKAHGIVAASTGNHAQGIAHAARRLGIAATIAMPADAPRVKLANTERLGAKVVQFDRQTTERDVFGRALADEKGCVFVPPFDDPYVIAGQGTIGLELAADCADMPLDDVLICCGGGGLSAGIALALQTVSPKTQVYIVEPEGYDDTVHSLSLGRRVPMDKNAHSICDAVAVSMVGALTFPLLQGCGVKGIVVSDEDVRRAMRYAYLHLKLVLEPAGALALAAVLSGHFNAKERHVGVLLSGGNVDPELFASIILP